MPKRRVPSGLKRASGMLMSPVGPAIAKEERLHAITASQHARERRIAPWRMERFHPRNAASAGSGARARTDFALPRLYQKNKTLPGFPWQGSASTGSGNRLVVVAVIRRRRGNSGYRCGNRGHRTCYGTRRARRTGAAGARSCTTRLRHRIASEHRKENHRYQLFHELPLKNHNGKFDGARTLAHTLKYLQSQPNPALSTAHTPTRHAIPRRVFQRRSCHLIFTI